MKASSQNIPWVILSVQSKVASAATIYTRPVHINGMFYNLTKQCSISAQA